MSGSIDPRTGLEELGRDECLRLVGASTLGRLAVVVDDQPLVFPVNFTLDGRAVVLRTDEGTKLYAARHGFVAFRHPACTASNRTKECRDDAQRHGSRNEPGAAAAAEQELRAAFIDFAFVSDHDESR